MGVSFFPAELAPFHSAKRWRKEATQQKSFFSLLLLVLIARQSLSTNKFAAFSKIALFMRRRAPNEGRFSKVKAERKFAFPSPPEITM